MNLPLSFEFRNALLNTGEEQSALNDVYKEYSKKFKGAEKGNLDDMVLIEFIDESVIMFKKRNDGNTELIAAHNMDSLVKSHSAELRRT